MAITNPAVRSNELILELLKVWGIDLRHVTDVTIYMPLNDVVTVHITKFAEVMDDDVERVKILKKFYLCEVKDEETGTEKHTD